MTEYYLEGPAGARPDGLAAYMEQYAVAVSVRCHDVTASNGAQGGGWVYPFYTGLGIAGGAAVGGAGGAMVGGGVGFLADLWGARGQGQAEDPPADPVVAAVAEIDFVGVSAKRAKWAEYLLCGWARASGWSVRRAAGRLLYDRNEAAPARPPRPWSAKTAGASALASLLDRVLGDGDRPRRRRGRG